MISQTLLSMVIGVRVEPSSVCNHTSDYQNQMAVKWETNLYSMTTDKIGRHKVLLPINQNYDKILEKCYRRV